MTLRTEGRVFSTGKTYKTRKGYEVRYKAGIRYIRNPAKGINDWIPSKFQDRNRNLSERADRGL